MAVAFGNLPYLAGASETLAATGERLLLAGARRLVEAAASSGAPLRSVTGLGGLLALLAPGVTAWLLVLAARGSLRLRWLVATLIVVLGLVGFAYHPQGNAAGSLVLVLVLAGLAVLLTGPLLAAPLCAGAGLLAGSYLPSLFIRHQRATQDALNALHLAIFNRPGHPGWLQVVGLLLAAIPFAMAARAVVAD